jgi:hypothetical protein
VDAISEYPISEEGMVIILEELAVRQKVIDGHKKTFDDKLLQL